MKCTRFLCVSVHLLLELCIVIARSKKKRRAGEMANWRLLMKLVIMAEVSMDALTRALEQLSSHRSPYARRHPLRRSRMHR
jgi:hypothetical protein